MLPFLFLTQEVKVFPLFDIKYGDYPVTTYSGWHFDNNIFSFSVCAFMCRWITFIHEIMVALHIKGQNFYLFIYLFFNFFWLNYVSLFYLTFTNTPNSYPLKLFFFRFDSYPLKLKGYNFNENLSLYHISLWATLRGYSIFVL